MIKALIAVLVSLGYLMLLGMVDERDQKLLAMQQSLDRCPLPQDEEVLHMTVLDGTYQCAYTYAKNGRLIRREL